MKTPKEELKLILQTLITIVMFLVFGFWQAITLPFKILEKLLKFITWILALLLKGSDIVGMIIIVGVILYILYIVAKWLLV